MSQAREARDEPQDDPREVWRQARRHISEYEDKLRELQFDLRHEEGCLKGAQEQQAQLSRDIGAASRLNTESQNEIHELNAKLVNLHRDSDRATEDNLRIQRQMKSLQADLDKVTSQQAETRQTLLRHLEQQVKINMQYQEHTAKAGQLNP